MGIVTGIGLVVLSLSIALALVAAMGLLPALATERGSVTVGTLRRSLWWGLLVTTVITTLTSLWLPLRSGTTVLVIVGTAAILGLVALPIVMRRGLSRRIEVRAEAVVIMVGLLGVLGVLSLTALGPVTNYDSGLYHLGAIRYASDYPAIPGLANLYGPLGYGNAEFVWAASAGNGPLADQAFRMINELVIVLAALDLGLRVVMKRWGAGTYCLLVGLAAALVPLVYMADYWVTSPSQDAPVLIVTIVATSYLVDTLVKPRWVPEAGVSAALAVLLVMLRPTSAVFAIALLLVLLVRGWRARRSVKPASMRPTGVLVVVLTLFAALATSARDYVLSGWLAYPLSLLAFDVPWLAPDPTGLRQATLGFWRDRSDMWSAVEGWAWVQPWLSTLPASWEAYWLSCLFFLTLGLVWYAARRGTLWAPRLLAAITPSAVGVVFWWVATPPGFRFGWGPLFTALTVPLGWALWRLSRGSSPPRWINRKVLGAAFMLPLIAVASVTAVARVDWAGHTVVDPVHVGAFTLEYQRSPLQAPPTVPLTLESGLTVRMPTESDQCWTVYPLCTPGTVPTTRLLGTGLEDGFRH